MSRLTAALFVIAVAAVAVALPSPAHAQREDVTSSVGAGTAVFSAPTAFEEDRTWGYRQLVARGEVTKASLAVRAQSGKSFAFASLSASGPVRLFVGRTCMEDS
jgi:hypothetical protein